MIKKFLKMIGRMAEAEDQPETTHSKEELMNWAVGCMLEGLPDDFYEAWVAYTKGEDQNDISYRFIAEKGAEIQKFEPADHLYPVQCIELLDEHLLEKERSWEKCVIKFSPKYIKLNYDSN